MLSRSNRRSGYRRRSAQASRRGVITGVLTALAILSAGAVVACSERVTAPALFSAVAPARELSSLGALTAANAGAYHNAFLDFSFPKVHKAVSKGASHAQACRIIAQAMREFILAYRLGEDPRNVGDDIAGARCPVGRKGATFALGTDGAPSPEFDAITNEMGYAVESGLSASELAPLFDQKVAYARSSLDPTEADVIEAAASVGLSSVDYWSANYETQLQELRTAMGVESYSRAPVDGPLSLTPAEALIIQQNPRFSWRAGAARVGLADLKGAVHGGISGIRGGWSGILAGAVIEGGGKSAGALIAELFK